MAKRRGTPDQRGMGAQSDFISESFLPEPVHKSRQLAMARALIATGMSPEQVAAMLSLPLTDLTAGTPEGD